MRTLQVGVKIRSNPWEEERVITPEQAAELVRRDHVSLVKAPLSHVRGVSIVWCKRCLAVTRRRNSS